MNDISYSKFINGLNKAGISINRKMLSELAIEDMESFSNLVVIAKDALAGKSYTPKVKKEVVKEEKKDDVKKVKEALDDGCNKDAPGSFISWLYDKSIVHAMKMPGKRYDIGNLDSYEKVNKEYEGIIL